MVWWEKVGSWDGTLLARGVCDPGAPLLSVFSLHGFVCGLSEKCQESCTQLRSGKLKQNGWPAQFDVDLVACHIVYHLQPSEFSVTRGTPLLFDI